MVFPCCYNITNKGELLWKPKLKFDFNTYDNNDLSNAVKAVRSGGELYR